MEKETIEEKRGPTGVDTRLIPFWFGNAWNQVSELAKWNDDLCYTGAADNLDQPY